MFAVASSSEFALKSLSEPPPLSDSAKGSNRWVTVEQTFVLRAFTEASRREGDGENETMLLLFSVGRLGNFGVQ